MATKTEVIMALASAIGRIDILFSQTASPSGYQGDIAEALELETARRLFAELAIQVSPHEDLVDIPLAEVCSCDVLPRLNALDIFTIGDFIEKKGAELIVAWRNNGTLSGHRHLTFLRPFWAPQPRPR
jgi:hypothetical protein